MPLSGVINKIYRSKIVLGIIVFSLVGIYLFFLGINVYRYHFSVPDQHPLFRADLEDIVDSTLSHYYVHTDGKKVEAVKHGLYANPPFDSDGIPLVDYKGNIGVQYYPITIAQYALDNWELFLQTGEQGYQETFLRQSEWLVSNQEMGAWSHRYEVPYLGLRNPWVSAMAQGQGISVLLRAYQLTQDERYLRSATEAFQLFKIPIEKKGVVCLENGSVWFEEYPNIEKPSHVLNGHMWAMFGLWDYYRVTNDDEAKQLFNRGVETLKKNLYKYDTGYWVLYDQAQKNFLVDQLYIDFQIDQLHVIHAITGDTQIEHFAVQWERYQKDKKNRYKIVIRSFVHKFALKLQKVLSQ